MQDHVRDDIRLLYRRHLEMPFPPRLRGEEIEGVDMVMVDADVAGCVDTWLGSSSNLDAGRIRVLRACGDDIDRILPSLDDPDEVTYYSSARDLARAVVAVQKGWT